MCCWYCSVPLQEHHLALRSEGVKMVVDSMQPHFVGVDPDILSTGLVFYYLRVCVVSFGLAMSKVFFRGIQPPCGPKSLVLEASWGYSIQVGVVTFLGSGVIRLCPFT